MNSSQRIAAARYAAAYDGLSTSIKQAEQNALQLKNATQVLAGVRIQMQSPRVPTMHKKLIVQETLKQWPQAVSFICVLLDAKRYFLLDEICAQVQTLLDDRKGISRAVITSARELSLAQQQAARRVLSNRYGRTIEAVFKTNPSLLGGLTMQCNGELLDASLQTRLAKLKEEITK